MGPGSRDAELPRAGPTSSRADPEESSLDYDLCPRVYLIRHADASVGAKDPGGGRHLTPLGQLQAAALARRIARWDVDAIVCSDKNRARETALAVHAFHRSVPLIVDATFREASRENIEAHVRGDPAQQDLFLRLETAWQRLLTFPYPATVLIAHTGVMKVLLGKVLKTVALKPRFHCTETGITGIRLMPNWPLLEFFNDTHHLTPELVTPRTKKPWIEGEAADAPVGRPGGTP